MMQKPFFTLILALIFFTACQEPTKIQHTSTNKSAATQAADRLCIPTRKVGAITATTSDADLETIYGGGNLLRDSVPTSNGAIMRTRIYPNEKDEVRVLWKANYPYEKISRVIIREKGSTWKTDKGIGIGTSMNELIKTNEVDFTFYGFESNYSGVVATWEGGVFDENKGFSARIAYKGDISHLTETERTQIIGGLEVSSATDALQKIQVEVVQLLFFF